MALVNVIATPMVAIMGARCGAWRARNGAKIDAIESPADQRSDSHRQQNRRENRQPEQHHACSAA